MSAFRGQVSRALDEEHRATIDLMDRIERAFAHAGRAPDPELAKLIGTFGGHVELELARHFAFEEHELFPRLTDAGDGDMAALLLEEHHAIEAVAGEFLPLARAATSEALDPARRDALKRSALELVERLRGHIHKETMGLLPLVDDLLDEDTDRDLAFAYATG